MRKKPWSVVWQVVAILVVLGLLFVVLMPVQEHTGSAKSGPLAVLKMTGSAAALYAEDNGDRFPLDVSSVHACAGVLRLLIQDHSTLVSENPGSPEFLGNGSLSAARVSTITDPDRVVLFFDSAPWLDGRRTVAYVDGNVRRAPEPEFQKAVANGWRFENQGVKP